MVFMGFVSYIVFVVFVSYVVFLGFCSFSCQVSTGVITHIGVEQVSFGQLVFAVGGVDIR